MLFIHFKHRSVVSGPYRAFSGDGLCGISRFRLTIIFGGRRERPQTGLPEKIINGSVNRISGTGLCQNAKS